MAGLFVAIAGFLGLCTGVCRIFRIRPAHAPFFSVSLLGILLFLFSLADQLKTGTLVLAATGLVCAVFFVPGSVKSRPAVVSSPVLRIFAGLLLFALVLSVGMPFTVMDDYVFWGIMGKSLVLFDRLPLADTTIIPRHLTYTPGAALVHYYFHLFSDAYLPGRAYFGQATILASALLTLVRPDQGKRSLVRLSIAVILFSLLAGSVFTKLQVDYLLSAFFLGILWVYVTEENRVRKLLTISVPLCFLFLIKQIGAVLGLVLILIMLADMAVCPEEGRGRRFSGAWILAGAGLGLVLLKLAWARYCTEMGFTAFNQAMTPGRIWAALQIFSPGPARDGFILFLKAVLFGPADRLNLPYLVWYAAIAFLWTALFKRMGQWEAKRFSLMLSLMGLFFLLYLVSLYFLQVVVFRIGVNFDHAVGMTRYINILFTQVLCFSFLMGMERIWFPKKLRGAVVLCFLVPALVLPLVSRIKEAAGPDPRDREAAGIAGRIQTLIRRDIPNRIAILPGTRDHFLGMKLLYHLLPDRVRTQPFPLENPEKSKQALYDSDYVLLYHLNNREKEWSAAYTDQPAGEVGFYKVLKAPASPGLQKLF